MRAERGQYELLLGPGALLACRTVMRDVDGEACRQLKQAAPPSGRERLLVHDLHRNTLPQRAQGQGIKDRPFWLWKPNHPALDLRGGLGPAYTWMSEGPTFCTA